MKITKIELLELIHDLESDRVERTISTTDSDKFCEAICAFANDFPAHLEPGYLLVGVRNDGQLAGMTISDENLLNLAKHRSNGQILPIPAINVERFVFPEGEVAVVEVLPADLPPVRYKGRVYLQVGPRKAIASEQEERILSERRAANLPFFDAQTCESASLADLSLDLFKLNYLPAAVAPEIIEENHRDLKEQLASLRFYNLKKDCPTYAGILLFGKNPLFYLPGAYVQFVRFDGNAAGSEVIDEHPFSGDLITMLRTLDSFLPAQIQNRPRPATMLREKMDTPYPWTAIRELVLNAIMHRDYQSNAPVRVYFFDDFIEIQNPGGLYGAARPENFPGQNDYRNPTISEALKTLNYVNRFSYGVQRSLLQLEQNGNPEPIFNKEHSSHFGVKIFRKPPEK